MAMTKASLRSFWFQIHKWIGIILAIVLIPLSLTGSLLVWDGPLDPWINPQRHAVTGPVALAPSAYTAAAAKVLPDDARIASLSMPEGTGPVIVSAAPAPTAGPRRGPPRRISVWLDPATAKVLEVGSQMNRVVRFLHDFHGHLMVPGVGRSIVGWLGVAMTLSCLTGLWLWWPMVGRLARAFRWRRQPQFDTNLHHMVGFWIALPLAVLSVTGVLISFPSLMGGGRERGGSVAARQAPGNPAAASAPQRPGPPRPLADTRLTPDQALAASGANRAPLTLTWPTEAEPNWRVSTRGSAPQTLAIDDATGAAKPAPAGGQQRSLVRALHDGTDMGIVWQTIIVLGGIAPAALGITGITMWLRTRRWRGQAARQATGRRAAAAAE